MDGAKDSIANLTSFGALASVWANVESVLTIVLLVSAIVLNIQRFRQTIKNKKEE
jgi:hypothetical protein